MKASRSGYYKWLKNKEKLNNYEIINDWDIDSFDLFNEFINKYIYYYNN